MQGRTVRLFLVDGSPTGLLTAEIMNWTGHALVAPRSKVSDGLKREEASRTGIYFLIGDDPHQPTKSLVYVGEADIIGERIKSHVKDDSKEFWTKACFVTSKDTNLTKAHARYLENRFIEIIKQAGRANIANGNEPGKKSLPESDVADMEFFISQIEILMPVFGFDFLQFADNAKSTALPTATPRQDGIYILRLYNEKHHCDAEAIEVGDEFVVLSGSKATKTKFTANSYSALRDQLIKDQRLVDDGDPNSLQFKDDVQFASPSAAAAVILNRNANGRIEWKLPSGQTLKYWQDMKILQS